MSVCCGTAETPNTCIMWSGIMLKHSILDVHVQNGLMLQVSDVCHCICHIHKSHPCTMMNSCPHHDTATTKMVDLLHTVRSVTFSVMYVRACVHQPRKLDSSENKTSSTWYVSISPSFGITQMLS